MAEIGVRTALLERIVRSWVAEASWERGVPVARPTRHDAHIRERDQDVMARLVLLYSSKKNR
jgi:hypothetical protein